MKSVWSETVFGTVLIVGIACGVSAAGFYLFWAGSLLFYIPPPPPPPPHTWIIPGKCIQFPYDDRAIEFAKECWVNEIYADELERFGREADRH